MITLRPASLPTLVPVTLAWAVIASSPVTAHGAIHQQIAELTRRIDADPRNAALYLKRGELHRVERRWNRALSDYDRASHLAPELAEVDFSRARMLLEADRPEPALVSIDRFLGARPGSHGGRVVRARILARMERHSGAAEEYDRALAALDLSSRVDPDLYLERARSLAAVGRVREAIDGLDAGIARLGPLVTLQLLAIELERAAGRIDQALGRLEAIASQTVRQEAWWVLRGEILRRAARTFEARKAFAQALAAIDALPAHLRGTRRMLELEAQARAALDESADQPREREDR